MNKKVEEIKNRMMAYLKRFPMIQDSETGELAKGIMGDLLFAEYTVESVIEMTIYETLELRRLEPKLQEIIRKEKEIADNEGNTRLKE